MVAIESSASYLSGVQQAVGAELLREQGNAQPTIEESTQAGQQAFNEWLDDQDVSIDPQFGVELQDGQAVPTDTSLSHAVGDHRQERQRRHARPGVRRLPAGLAALRLT